MLAERGRIFVHGKSRTVGGDLEQNSAWLQEIDRLEPEPVDYLGRPSPRVLDSLAHLELGFVIGDAPGDMMHAAGSPATALGVGNLADL